MTRLALVAAAGCTVVGLVVAAVLVAGGSDGPDPTPVETSGSPVPVPVTGAYLGASASVHDGETRIEAIEAAEAQIGRPLDIDHQFYRWDQPLVTAAQHDDVASGRVPFVSWKPLTEDGAAVTWASIVAGEQDDHIRAVARTMRDFGRPMFAAFNHEPYDESLEGWGTPADFVAAYRHVVELARAEGATNVAWVLVLTSWDYEQGRGDAFHPGADVVDWLAVDAHNGMDGGRWVSLEDLADDFYEWAAPTGQPLMLAEWGSVEDPATPGRKAQWLDEAAETLRRWPNIRAVVYFDNLHGTDDWRIDTSPSALDAFRRLAGTPHFDPFGRDGSSS